MRAASIRGRAACSPRGLRRVAWLAGLALACSSNGTPTTAQTPTGSSAQAAYDAVPAGDLLPADALDELVAPIALYLKVLKRQGGSPPGGPYDYVINGNMIGGFALLAWPAEYGETGVMTFAVSHQGKVFQKDLGPATAKLAEAMVAYDPDASWSEVTD
jgi:Protein of unknown function (DUF2950)